MLVCAVENPKRSWASKAEARATFFRDFAASCMLVPLRPWGHCKLSYHAQQHAALPKQEITPGKISNPEGLADIVPGNTYTAKRPRSWDRKFVSKKCTDGSPFTPAVDIAALESTSGKTCGPWHWVFCQSFFPKLKLQKRGVTKSIGARHALNCKPTHYALTDKSRWRISQNDEVVGASAAASSPRRCTGGNAVTVWHDQQCE